MKQSGPENLPGVRIDLPGTHSDLPGVHSDLPGVHNNLPGAHNNLPGAHNNLPEAHNELPGQHDDTPKDKPAAIPLSIHEEETEMLPDKEKRTGPPPLKPKSIGLLGEDEPPPSSSGNVLNLDSGGGLLGGGAGNLLSALEEPSPEISKPTITPKSYSDSAAPISLSLETESSGSEGLSSVEEQGWERISDDEMLPSSADNRKYLFAAGGLLLIVALVIGEWMFGFI
mgnify:CR=1 FL=1